jgi:hypothetical protein
MSDIDTGDQLITPREYARHRRCSIRTLDRERETRTGCPYIRIGGRILYWRRDIDRFLDAHRIGAGAYRGEPIAVAGDPRPGGTAPPVSNNTSAAPRRRGRPRKTTSIPAVVS